jgi:hemoglobin/transferrin/lactoferrin receptor protein
MVRAVSIGCTVALATLPAARTGSAQEAGAGVNYAIPAGNLGPALTRWAQLSGYTLLAPGNVLEGRSSPGLAGSYPPQQALGALLDGTGLNYSIDGSTVTVSDPSADNAGATLEGAIALDTINVSGGNAGTPPADLPYETPGSSAYISGEQIARVPPTTPGDMFKSTPGVIAVGDRSGPSINLNIRGLQGQDRVNVMVDGTRQSNNSYRGYPGSRNEVYVDPDFLAGIEITKGPSGEAGGIGAMGGVVNMRTIEAGDIVKPGETTGTRLKLGFGSNTIDPPATGTQDIRNKDDASLFGDTWSGSVATATKQENYDLLFGFSRRITGNYFAGTDGAETYFDIDFRGNPRERKMSPFKHGDEVFGTSQNVTSFIAKGNLRWGDGHELETGYVYYDNKYGELSETLLAFSVGTGFTFPPSHPAISETTTHTLRAKYTYNPAGNDLVALKATAWATDVNTYNGPAQKNIHTYGGDISNRARVGVPLGELVVTTGGEAVLERGGADSGGLDEDLNNPFSEPKGERQMLGAFSRATWKLTNWLTLEGGLRFDRYEADPDNADYPHKEGERASPSTSIIVTPLEGLQLFASYTEGWRPPSLRETSAGARNNFLAPNPDLDPEISKNVEIGLNVLRGDVLMEGDSVRFKAVRFHNDYEDYIVRGQPPGIPNYTWINIDHAEFDGYEISGSYDAGYFFVQAGFTKYDKAQFCQNEWWSGNMCNANGVGQDYGIQNLPPEYSGNVAGGVRLLDRRLVLGAQAYFFGQRLGGYEKAPTSTVAPVYYYANTIVDLFGSYQFHDNAKLDFSIENIADIYYIDPLALGVIPSPGRTARFGLTMEF